ncbi:hypothetical protein M407DRAFT_129728 [Tulasnella calospora MUT 4182]|uniref:Uncharacterized protein n=1 Tax=Tulasnella calospora MUT 4182 TaxID=1051891 RepID=A0A0C3PVW7_9AGAM|nr:hypothetical protein M407DRAFT_150345 [Tulasnella calospora MUT 4182]KIO21240.1 hypothetical protein M407DRAFT_129728 [Tulasnella calospora MUT 4182]
MPWDTVRGAACQGRRVQAWLLTISGRTSSSVYKSTLVSIFLDILMKPSANQQDHFSLRFLLLGPQAVPRRPSCAAKEPVSHRLIRR